MCPTKMAEKLMTNRQLQALETKQRIFDATMKLGEKYGFEKLNISDICEEAKISIGSFYNYFRSIAAVIQEDYHKFDEYVEAYLREFPPHGSAIDCILYMLSMKYEFVMTRGVHPGILQFKGMFEQIDTQNEAFLEADRIFPKTITKFIRQGINDGELCLDMKPEELSRTILILSRGYMLDWVIQNGTYNLEKTAIGGLKLFLYQFRTS